MANTFRRAKPVRDSRWSRPATMSIRQTIMNESITNLPGVEATSMSRRNALKWLSGLMASACSAVVAIPGVNYILMPLLGRRGQHAAIVQRVTRWQDLPVSRPIQFPIVGNRRDAWTVHPDEVLGRVWVVRQPGQTASPAEGQVLAFSTLCPHLGCAIQQDAKSGQFVCPCHKAAFNQNGEKVSDQQLGRKNHAPRGLDALACHVVQDESTREWWVEVTYEKFEQGLTKMVKKV